MIRETHFSRNCTLDQFYLFLAVGLSNVEATFEKGWDHQPKDRLHGTL